MTYARVDQALAAANTTDQSHTIPASLLSKGRRALSNTGIQSGWSPRSKA
jgi:hypothetical protein